MSDIELDIELTKARQALIDAEIVVNNLVSLRRQRRLKNPEFSRNRFRILLRLRRNQANYEELYETRETLLEKPNLTYKQCEGYITK
jgi:hypothetical protein